MTNISFVIPTYNNLRYLKNAYRSVRQYAGNQHEVIILDDASTDGTSEWVTKLSESDANVTFWHNTNERLGHTITYNVGAKLAKNPIFCILHADMFIGPDYVENVVKHLKPGTVVSATRVEPPLHPEGKEKIVKDFGLWPETFDEKSFVAFVKQEQVKSRDKTTKGIFAPWFMYTEDFLRIGGHDPLFAPFPYEDSDIFQRFILAGYEIVQSRDALVYHLTCRGHKWTDDTHIGKVDDSFAVAEFNARKNYLRKWNSWIKNDLYHCPIISPKYNTCLLLSGVSEAKQISFYEPWFGKVIVDTPELVDQYIQQEQPTTLLDLRTRITSEKDDLTIHDVYVTIDNSTFTKEDYDTLQQLNDILSQLEESDSPEGEYELGRMKVRVNRLKNVVHELIQC